MRQPPSARNTRIHVDDGRAVGRPWKSRPPAVVVCVIRGASALGRRNGDGRSVSGRASPLVRTGFVDSRRGRRICEVRCAALRGQCRRHDHRSEQERDVTHAPPVTHFDLAIALLVLVVTTIGCGSESAPPCGSPGSTTGACTCIANDGPCTSSGDCCSDFCCHGRCAIQAAGCDLPTATPGRSLSDTPARVAPGSADASANAATGGAQEPGEAHT